MDDQTTMEESVRRSIEANRPADPSVVELENKLGELVARGASQD